MIKIESFTIGNWEEIETGVFLDENEDWVLIKSIPVDYQLDGYKLLSKNYIQDRFTADDAELISKVLTLREDETRKPEGFTFRSTLQTLKWLEDTYGCFEFQDEMETELFYGVIDSFDITSFTIDSIQSDGTIDLDFDEEFKINDIRAISFESDYFKAMNVLYTNNNKTE